MPTMLKLPLELERPGAQRAMARLILKEFSVQVRRIYAIDVDRIAFVDHRGKAKTALIELTPAGGPKLKRVVFGWPVE